MGMYMRKYFHTGLIEEKSNLKLLNGRLLKLLITELKIDILTYVHLVQT